jgi:hypothetical protein
MKNRSRVLSATALILSGLGLTNLVTHAAQAQEKQRPIGYEHTPMLPGGKWHVHDGRRPPPPSPRAGRLRWLRGIRISSVFGRPSKSFGSEVENVATT